MITGVTVATVADAGAEVNAAIEFLAADLVAVNAGAAFDRSLRFAAWASSKNKVRNRGKFIKKYV
jgi:hypothetical protein